MEFKMKTEIIKKSRNKVCEMIIKNSIKNVRKSKKDIKEIEEDILKVVDKSLRKYVKNLLKDYFYSVGTLNNALTTLLIMKPEKKQRKCKNLNVKLNIPIENKKA